MSIRKRYTKDGNFTWEFCITISKNPRKQYRKSGYLIKDVNAHAVDVIEKTVSIL